MVLSPRLRVASDVIKQLSVTPVSMGSCPPAMSPILGAKFQLLQVYHSIQEEWLIL